MFINFRDIGKIINIEKVRDFSIICSEAQYYIHAVFDDGYIAENIPAGESEKEAYDSLDALSYLISFKNNCESFSLCEKEDLLNEMYKNDSQNPESNFDDLTENFDSYDDFENETETEDLDFISSVKSNISNVFKSEK